VLSSRAVIQGKGFGQEIPFPEYRSSLQTVGLPHLFWIDTDLDFGFSVTRMASANWVAPLRIFSRAAARNTTLVRTAGMTDCPFAPTD
jgi:hypothetical protein